MESNLNETFTVSNINLSNISELDVAEFEREAALNCSSPYLDKSQLYTLQNARTASGFDYPKLTALQNWTRRRRKPLLIPSSEPIIISNNGLLNSGRAPISNLTESCNTKESTLKPRIRSSIYSYIPLSSKRAKIKNYSPTIKATWVSSINEKLLSTNGLNVMNAQTYVVNGRTLIYTMCVEYKMLNFFSNS